MTTADTHQAPEIVEEHFLDEGTDVEAEKDLEEAGAEAFKPWDPDQIRVNTKQFSLRNVLDMIGEESLELAPDFQRGRVWNLRQKSRLIESLLLQIPLPAFYFAEDTDGLMRVVDGLQRLSTIMDFVRGDDEEGFVLKGLEYLTDEEGKRFAELPAPWRRRIHNAQILVHVIDPTTPPDVKYDIFKRINTGGTPLNSQEIRHCMSRDRSRDILKRMTGSAAFDQATRGNKPSGMHGHVRMNDREMVLRFAAFWLLGVDAYAEKPAMDSFLERTTTMLDNAREVPDEQVEALVKAFETAMWNAWIVFDEHAFRKWQLGVNGLNPVNRALFESWALALAPYKAQDLDRRKSAIVQAARKLMTEDFRYLDAITSSTGDIRRVQYRFAAAAEAAEAGR